MTTVDRGRRLAEVALPIVAIASVVIVSAAAAWSASVGHTLGFDFRAYDLAVRDFLRGGVLYDQSYGSTGGFGLFYYPPTFVLLVIPLALLDPTVATWAWTVGLVLAFAAAVAILPVGRRLRWIVLLLGAISWPLVYAIKLGQVGPILLLLFALGWRWLDRPAGLGVTAAIGTAIKLQPGLLFAWAVLTGRWRAVVAGVATLAIVALVATLLIGPHSWIDQATLLAKVSRPIDTPNSVTPGRIAVDLGAPAGLAWAVQIANWVLVAVVVTWAAFRCLPVASYLAVVVAAQLASPILWDHYALVVLLPVAWLLSRGRRWAVLLPLATSIFLVGDIPPIVYPTVLWVAMAWVVVEGRGPARTGQLPAQASPGAGAMLAG